jgi:hypothetical protein
VSHTIQEDESCCIYHELLSACQDPKIPATVAACFQVPHLLYCIGISFNILDQESWIIMSCSYSGVSKKNFIRKCQCTLLTTGYGLVISDPVFPSIVEELLALTNTIPARPFNLGISLSIWV